MPACLIMPMTDSLAAAVNNAFRMMTVRDHLSVVQTIFVGSHVREIHMNAAEKYLDTAKKGRVTVTLTMSATVHSCADGTTASIGMR